MARRGGGGLSEQALLARVRERLADPRLATEGADAVAPTVHSPASAQAVASAERALGFRLPRLLTRLYREVGNGGFGPGYGLLGVHGGATDAGRSIVDLYRGYRAPDDSDPGWRWPEQLLPVAHLGCGMYACVDCTDAAGPVVWFEPNARTPGEPLDVSLIPVAPSLADWLWAWDRGEDWLSSAWDRSDLGRRQQEHDPQRD